VPEIRHRRVVSDARQALELRGIAQAAGGG
jgi:hypothetical protein